MHQEPQLFFTTASIVFILLLAAASVPIAQRLRVPDAVILVLLGGLIPLIISMVSPYLDHGFFDDFLQTLKDFRITPEIVFYLFLPTLIFESSFHLRLDVLRRSIIPITLLSSVGVVLSATLITLGCHYLLGIDWGVSLIYGVMISATDPVAVLGNFKSLGAPKRLRTIVEGESLFNDATTLVLFKAILPLFVIGAGATGLGIGSLYTGFEHFMLELIGGVGIGLAVSFVFALLVQSVNRSHNVELTLVLVLAHTSFLSAELFGFSGIISTVVAGLIMGNYGRRKLTPSVVTLLEEVWDHLAFLINGIVFVLVGISLVSFLNPDLLLIAIGAAIITSIARYLTIIPVVWFGNLFSKPVNYILFSWQLVIAHGGFRGVLAVVMLLLIPEEGFILDRDLLTALVVGTVLFSLFVHASTAGLVIKMLGITKFRIHDELELSETRALIARTMRFYLQKLKGRESISEKVIDQLTEEYNALENSSGESIRHLLEEEPDSTRQLDLLFRKHCMSIERQIYYDMYKRREIQESTLVSLVNSLNRQRDRLLLGMGQERTDAEPNHTPFLEHFTRKQQRFEKWLGITELNVFGIRQRLYEKWRRSTILRKHERYRARSTAAQEVVTRMSEFSTAGLQAEQQALVEQITNQYREWQEHAADKQHQLEDEYPEILMSRQRRILQHNVSAKESEITEQLHDFGMVSDRIYIELIQEQEIRNGNA